MIKINQCCLAYLQTSIKNSKLQNDLRVIVNQEEDLKSEVSSISQNAVSFKAKKVRLQHFGQLMRRLLKVIWRLIALAFQKATSVGLCKKVNKTMFLNN